MYQERSSNRLKLVSYRHLIKDKKLRNKYRGWLNDKKNIAPIGSKELSEKIFNDKDIEHALEAASLARDSVDMYVQEELNGDVSKDLETLILEHPLMQAELARQNEDINFLQALGNDFSCFFPLIKNRWFNYKKSCLSLQI